MAYIIKGGKYVFYMEHLPARGWNGQELDERLPQPHPDQPPPQHQKRKGHHGRVDQVEAHRSLVVRMGQPPYAPVIEE